MIPARPGLVARYATKTMIWEKPVVAFTEDGRPMVVPDEGARLVAADTEPNFTRVDHAGEGFIAVAPAGGWLIEYREDDGKTYTEPLIGWGVQANGSVAPLVLSDAIEGTTEIPDCDVRKFRIYHPEGRKGLSAATDPRGSRS